jgi:hypothetical protein
MSTSRNSSPVFLFCFSFLTGLFLQSAQAQGALAALNTEGITFQVNQKTGVAVDKTNETISGFSLGGTARKGNKLYYVAEPSASDENSLYVANLTTLTLTHVDLDRDDSVRALFFKGNKLFGILYNGDLGTAGLYRIAPTTGVTTLILDLSTLDVEPLAGAFTKFGSFYYMLTQPEIDGTQRRLLRFKTKAGSATLFEVEDNLGNPVLCEKLKPNAPKNNFVCMASAAAETEVKVCRMTLKGKVTCLTTLTDIRRVGSGHTLLQLGNNYYAFVYALDEEDNQRLIKFNAKGILKANLVLDTIMIGAHFAGEGQ